MPHEFAIQLCGGTLFGRVNTQQSGVSHLLHMAF
jgi:hypothetical protein